MTEHWYPNRPRAADQPMPAPSPRRVEWGMPRTPSPAPRLASASPLARWTVLLLGVTGVLSAVATMLELNEVRFVAPPPGTFVSEQELTASWSRLYLINGLRHLSLLVTGTAFLLWLHRAYTNLRVLRPRAARLTPAWAVGSCFVPIAHLVFPFLAVRDLWTADDTHTPTRGRGTALLGWWWALWVFTTAFGFYVAGPYVFGYVSGFVIGFVFSAAAAHSMSLVFVLSTVAYGLAHLATTVLAIKVVRETDRRQAAREVA